MTDKGKTIAAATAALLLGFAGGVAGSALHPGPRGVQGIQGAVGNPGPVGPASTPYPTPTPSAVWGANDCGMWSAPDANGNRICQVTYGGVVNPAIN